MFSGKDNSINQAPGHIVQGIMSEQLIVSKTIRGKEEDGRLVWRHVDDLNIMPRKWILS